ncbi:fluoride efflux transporter FluC [Streptomyces radicis]|uniref:Fluoride-specific ion channel FluC n=1 Tax=Streptomyces radicis TaxID=1750517 RepID=A0A3A9WBA3_9ACTN|nr:CrcB family protein [Streptomyces radicis]RKN10090.1 CrcB family protein [Streptomyces radicis]RKN24432.1 CrcB family protein [Streptomyces radicis]
MNAPAPRRHPPPGRAPEWPVVAAVAAGGALGSAGRYGAYLLWPTREGGAGFPWTTLGINVVGCALIGVLLVLVTEAHRGTHRLVRPFLGTGVLGGFTTFSTYTQDAEHLLRAGRVAVAAGYLAATLLAALLATWLAAAATRAASGVAR